MRSAHEEIRRRTFECARRLGALDARLQATLDARAIARIAEEVRTIVGQLDTACTELEAGFDEQATRRSETDAAQARAETAFRMAYTPCLSINRDASIVAVNPSAATLLNVSTRHIVSRSFTSFLFADRPAFLKAVSDVLATGRTVRWPARLRPRDKAAFSATLMLAPEPIDHVLVAIHVKQSVSSATPDSEMLPTDELVSQA